MLSKNCFLISNRRIANFYTYIMIILLFVLPLVSARLTPNNKNETIALRNRRIEQLILERILGENYDTRIRPAGKPSNNSQIKADGPCEVEVNMMVRSITRIDDVKMEYSTQLTFREFWSDSRLVYTEQMRKHRISNNSIEYIALTEPGRVWLPDLFFRNEKKGRFHKIILPNVLLRIYPNGRVTYSVRISLILFCPMQLHFFPLDIQTCTINMTSYGYTDKDIHFGWKKGQPNKVVQLPPKLYLPRFSLIKYSTARCDVKTNTGTYSCIVLSFVFKREFSYYLFLIYVPCSMLVIVSWVSFWIDPNSSAARVLLGVLSLLTMSRQISGINASLPPVSYTKAVDVWTECCLIFVFTALLEFAVVNYVSRSDAHRAGNRRRARPTMIGARKKYDSGKDSGIDSSDVEEGAIGFARSLGTKPLHRHATKLPKKKKPKRSFYNWWVSRFTTRAKKIDVTSRILFPVLFAIFNAFYWTKYLFREDLAELV
ncbi:glutamate-gated chloride channel-like isoform X2 [Brevipalpus obovatus]|uniref:glutamate-gated chloride channel-like isoform X2 n=1 Tax=Brevipalpus obovatus TaxID=246614 RepID=UPI003D9EFC27